MKVREMVRVIKEDGWFLTRTRGSHHQYRHSVKKGLVTIAGKPNEEMAPGTVRSVLRQAGLKE